MGSFGKRSRFVLLRFVRFDDANAGDAFGEAAGEVRRHLAALLEHRPRGLERPVQNATEKDDRGEDDQSELGAEIKENADRDRRGEQSPHQLNQPRSHEISNPLGVIHDARDDDSGLRAVEIRDGQPLDVFVDFLSEIGNRFLCGETENLRECVIGDGADGCGDAGDEHDLSKEIEPVMDDHAVDQVFGRAGENDAGEPVDHHQRQAESEPSACGPHDVARIAQKRHHVGAVEFSFRLVRHRSGHSTRQWGTGAPPVRTGEAPVPHERTAIAQSGSKLASDKKRITVSR